MINSHAYFRKYSRLSLLDASLTLGEINSLFSLPPVAKQHLGVLLGRLPTSRSSGKKERMDIDREVIDRTQTKEPTKKAGRLTCFFVGSPCWA